MSNRGSFISLKSGASVSISCGAEDAVLLSVSNGYGSLDSVITIDSEGVVLLADALYKSVGLEPVEQLFYLKLLDGCAMEEQYINYRKEDGEVFIADLIETPHTQTKFTLQEINSNPKLKKYAQFKVPVK